MCRYSPQGPRSGERGYVIAYSYDLENRLAAATVNRLEGTNTVNVVAGYVHNPFGIRVRADTTTTINQGTPVAKKKAFVIDAQNGTGYAQVLEEKDGSGALTMSYTIGDDVISQSGPSVTHHFGYDGHGSTRILTDDTAAIESGTRYNYDAYGVQVGTQSSVLSPAATSLLYTGEQFDVDLQQYYLRARYYDQNRGRFTQIDPVAGLIHDPSSLHKYAYCYDDPLNRVDPSGNRPPTLAELQASVAGLVTVAAAYISRVPSMFQQAFRAGPAAVGRLFNQLGTFAQYQARQVLELFRIDRPAFEILENQQVGTRFIDFIVRYGDKIAQLEVKWGLPSKAGSALDRLVAQSNAMIASGQGQAVVWTLRMPNSAQQKLATDALGNSASSVRFIHGIPELFKWVAEHFGF